VSILKAIRSGSGRASLAQSPCIFGQGPAPWSGRDRLGTLYNRTRRHARVGKGSCALARRELLRRPAQEQLADPGL